MEDIKMIYLKGHSGKNYRFYSFNSSGHFKKAGGIYMVANLLRDKNKNRYEVLYVGETDDLSMLTDSHVKSVVPEDKEANCICARLEHDAGMRKATITDIEMTFASNAS
ncbi:MAG: hypothetical protein R6T99_06275 [Bacteroidales bacterium]